MYLPLISSLSIVFSTTISSFVSVVSSCSNPKCSKKLSLNFFKLIGNANPLYQSVISADKISFIASYATSSRLDLSAVGLNDATLYVPKTNGSSVLSSSIVETVIHFPSSGTLIFAIVILNTLASQFPNVI